MSDDASAGRSPPGDDLVERAKTEPSAFGCLFDRYYSRVLRYCLRRLLDRAEAEDVTSEVFLKVASHMRGFAGRGESDFRRWLFRIATNAVNAQLRQTVRRRALLKEAVDQRRLNHGVEQSSSLANQESLDWPVIERALSELGPQAQAIVTLRFFAELTHDEIAEVIDSTPGAVRTALSRTLARLRERFDPTPPSRADE